MHACRRAGAPALWAMRLSRPSAAPARAAVTSRVCTARGTAVNAPFPPATQVLSRRSASTAPLTALQDKYAPGGVCFGCGTKNESGLQIKSHVVEDADDTFPIDSDVDGVVLRTEWSPQPHHVAVANVLNGGVISSLLDCASNWAAMEFFRRQESLDFAAPCVTGRYTVTFMAPTPMSPVVIHSRVVKTKGRGATVAATLQVEATGEVTATSEGVFFRVRDDHPSAVAMAKENEEAR